MESEVMMAKSEKKHSTLTIITRDSMDKVEPECRRTTSQVKSLQRERIFIVPRALLREAYYGELTLYAKATQSTDSVDITYSNVAKT